MAQPSIQTSFASGEWAPKLRSRVDISKYRLGAALLRNFYVDWSGGGASTRQGTRFIAPAKAAGARLIPFQPSANVSYVLEFGNNYIRFYTNGAQVMSGGVPYEITSPFVAADLFPNPLTGNPGIKFVQDVTSLIICHPNYKPQILTIIAPTNWTITQIAFGQTIPAPTSLTLTTSLAALASGWSYSYTVTAVDINGQESAPATPITINNFQGLWDSTHLGTNLFGWAAVTGAVSYNVYKAEPVFNSTIQAGVPYGFIGNVTGNSFTDVFPGFSPDFAQTPPILKNPFLGAGVSFFTVTTPGSYTVVPGVTVGAPPAGGVQATAQAQMSVLTFTLNNLILTSSSNPIGDLLYYGNAVFQITSDTTDGFGHWTITGVTMLNAGAITGAGTTLPTGAPTAITGGGTATYTSGTLDLTWQVSSVGVVQAGAGYATAPSVTFSAGTAAATSTLGAASAGNPGVPSFFQERLVLAAQQQAVQNFNMSQPGSFFNFNGNFPVEDDDAIQGTIISDDLNNIRSLTAVPSGLIALTGKSAWLINGGGGLSAANPVTPTSVAALPQAFNGANDIRPLKVNMDILYCTNKGSYVRDLTYNIYMNIFTGTDITTLSNHLFFGFYVVDWAWAEEPFKTLWAIRNDGILLSLGYVKEQELIGWAHHDTSGQFKSIASVIETSAAGNTVDAVYVVVERFINGSIVEYVERIQDRYFPYGYEDSWSVDCGLSTAPFSSPPGVLSISGDASTIGNSVTLTDTADAPFTAIMATNNYVVRAGGGIYRITAFTSTSIVTAAVVRVPATLNPYTNGAYNVTGFAIWQPITSVSGLTQLKNTAVVGVADGNVISGTVSGTGTLALTGGPFTKVTLGLAFTPQLQCLPLDLGEPTVQGKRKKIAALTLRVADTLGLSAGTTFANVVPMKDFTIGNIPSTSTGASVVSDLYSGDGRTIIDQAWQELGNYCIQQNQPYPATILGVMPEVVVGDTK